MRNPAIHRFRPALVLALAALLVGCRQGARPGAPTATTGSPTPRSGPLSPDDPTGLRLGKVDMLISQWDVAQASGRKEQADLLAGQIRQEVDQGYSDFVSAARGSMGIQTQYLGVSALGFSGRSDATRELLERLRERDAELVGNALIALKIRADPNTPLDPVLRQLRSPAIQPRRYAPLVIANVLDAKQRQGRPADPAMQRQIASSLSAVVADRDPLVRLHVGKALGKLNSPGTFELLMVLMKDEYIRIRIAAAAGLERLGDGRGMPEVIRLLDDVEPELKPLVQDLLTTYAARVQGRPLTASELEALGSSSLAWSRWYTATAQARGIPLPDTVRSPAASLQPRASTPPPASPWSSTPAPAPRAVAPSTIPAPRAVAPSTIPAPRRVERAPMPSPPPPPPPPLR